jgi:iron complex outermembrane recepter protein
MNHATTARCLTRLALFAATTLTTPALAQTAAAPTSVEELVVTGSRVSEATVAIGTDEVTATVSITSAALMSAPAGITGLKMLESLPGFNVQANDALGMYEFGNSVSVRAFGFRQIGFLLDDIPMGRSDQFGGSPIYRYVDNENLSRVTASAGSGDVSLASYASLGPIVSYITREPLDEMGGRVSFTRGSDDLMRVYGRIDTGEHNGFSAFGSVSVIEGDLWRGPGTIDRTHFEAKARYRWETGSLTFQTVHNDYFDFDSPSITKAQYLGTAGDIFGRSGRGFAYIDYIPTPGAFGSPATATSLPITSATAPPFSNTAYNQYFKFAINERKDHLYGLTLANTFGETISVSATAYYEDKNGYGVSPEAYVTSLASHNAQRLIVAGLTAPKGIQYGLSTADGTRKGLNSRISWDLGMHKLEAGVWLEDDDYHRTQNRFNVENGNPDGAPLLNEPVHRQRDYDSNRKTTQIFLKDTIALFDDALRVDVGFKGLSIDYSIEGFRNPADYINRRQPRIEDSWKDLFLPQIGAVWSIGREQIFASYSENMALPQGADDIFSQASPLAPGPDPETAKNYELGIRTNRPTFNASLVAYMTSFTNRLQAFASIVPGSTTTETFFQNVGTVDAHGVEFSGQWKPELFGGKVYFNTNLSYNISEFQNNFSTNLIRGNTVPDFPKWLFQGGVTVEPMPGAVLNLSARHISKRFTNFTNAESTGGYMVYSAYIDIGDGFEWGPFEEIKARINVDNLFDKDYLGTITTTIATPATFRPGPRRTVQVSFTTAF